jgi:outer membrane protein OmpA-like peptidoglycan-associated protein
MEIERDDAAGEEPGGPWPAFADLLAATTLLFLILFAAVAVPAIGRARQAEAAANTLRHIERVIRPAARDSASVLRVGDYLLVRIQGEATFPRDRYQLADLKPQGKEILRRFGKLLRQDTVLPLIDQVQVVGHTSSEGTEEHNWLLSAQRAATVTLFLIDSAGVAPCQVSALGRSRYYPVDPAAARRTRTPSDFDRRIELEIRPVIPSDTVQRARRRSCVDRRSVP